jgi:hypothetical protein
VEKMSKEYHLDPEKVSLEKLRLSLEMRKLIPSRLILKEKLSTRFEILSSAGILNLKELIDALKSKKKIEVFSKWTGLEVEYLTILKREASSYFPNPVRLSSFPGIKADVIRKLEENGLKNSKQLFYATTSRAKRERLCLETGLSDIEIMEVVQLSDLVRLYGVGPAFARLLFDTGIRSVEKFLEYGPQDIVRIYEEKHQKKADFSESDILFTHELARELEISFRRNG